MANKDIRYCYTYEGPELKEIAPTLQPGEKIHYPIYHDETCVHANDQSNFVWIKEDEQPLRNKSRGRIVHVSDFIIEHSGRLVLSDDEIMEQMKLPEKPLPPPDTELPSSETPLSLAKDPEVDATAVAPPEPTGKKTKSRKQKEPKKKKEPKKNKTPNKKPVTTARTLATAVEDEWVPPPPPAPFPSYRLSSFDAQRIIYPGANYDPWWDMPQLIAQV